MDEQREAEPGREIAYEPVEDEDGGYRFSFDLNITEAQRLFIRQYLLNEGKTKPRRSPNYFGRRAE